MFGYHMGINGGTYNTKTDIDKVLTAGAAENKSFNSDLDRYAQYIQPLAASWRSRDKRSKNGFA